MENMILGLLILQSRTIYQLRERIDKGLSLMYSSSMGSIQSAIGKLLARGYIDFEETVDGGRHKKVYRITQSGKERFSGWINSPIEEIGVKCPELVKLYFLGLGEKESRASVIDSYISMLKERLAVIESICGGAKEAEPDEEHAREIFRYQLASALYARDLYEFNIGWFENLLKQIRSEEL